MNVFCCSVNPRFAARNLSYKWHVGKMFVESLQISAAIAEAHDVEMPLKKDGTPYGISHVNHPAVRWAAESKENYEWLIDHMRELAVILQEQGSSAWTQSFWEWESTAYELAGKLKEVGEVRLYEQNGAFGNMLPKDTYFRNQEIAHRTVCEILLPKYVDWMTRKDKTRALPTWPHSDNVPECFLKAIDQYGHGVPEKLVRVASKPKVDSVALVDKLLAIL